MTTLFPNMLLHQRYRVFHPIGQGGFGVVYEAMDEALNRRVAVKQLLRAGERISRQFIREAQLLANLIHPTLPRVTDYFSSEDGQFLVMDFVPGDDLATLIMQRDAPYPLVDVLTWGFVLLDALHYLHTRQPPIIHRDIKPQNLKLQADGAIMLLDFGLAKGYAGDVSPPTTESSFVAYTKGYASPEQVEGQGTDARSDLYSLAATLHYLLTNVPPIFAETRLLAEARQRPDPLRPAHEHNPAVPSAVSQVLTQALALDPNLRPPTAQAMRTLLQAARTDALSPAYSIDTPPAARSEPTVIAQQAAGSELTVIASSGAEVSAQPLPRFKSPSATTRWVVGGAAVVAVLATIVGLATAFGSGRGSQASLTGTPTVVGTVGPGAEQRTAGSMEEQQAPTDNPTPPPTATVAISAIVGPLSTASPTELPSSTVTPTTIPPTATPTPTPLPRTPTPLPPTFTPTSLPTATPTFTPPPTATPTLVLPTPFLPPPATRRYRVSDPPDHYVVMRAAPRTDSREIRRLVPDEEVVCTRIVTGQQLIYQDQASNAWALCEDESGYVFLPLLIPLPPVSEDPPATPTAQRYLTSDPPDHVVTMRAEPNTTSRVVQRFAPGTELTCSRIVTGEQLLYQGQYSSAWALCEGETGYIFLPLLIPITASSSTGDRALVAQQRGFVGAYVQWRKKIV